MKTIKLFIGSVLFLTILLVTTSCTETKAQKNSSIKEEVSDTIVKEKPILNENGTNVQSRFNTPEGFTRVELDSNSFGSFLQNLPLKPHGSQVLHYDGTLKLNVSAYLAVVDLPIGNRDLQQCADAVMRLRADYLFSQKRYDEIEFLFVSGRRSNYISYLGGKTPNSKNLWSYLENVFTYASTLSLDKQLKQKDVKDLNVGDVFIKGGSPGHAVIVIDKCFNKDGEVKFMLAQSFMPAQEIQVLSGDDGQSPWYNLNFGDYFNSAEYTFTKDQLKSF